MTRKIIGHTRTNRSEDEQAEKAMFFMDVMAALETQFTKNELEFFLVQSDSQLHKKIKTSAKLIKVNTEPNYETKLKEEDRVDLIFKNISTNIFEDRKQQIQIKQSANRQRIQNQRQFLNTPKPKIKQKVFVTKKMQNINRKMGQQFDLFGRSFSPIADSMVPSHFPFNTLPYSMDIQKRCRTQQRNRPRQAKQTFGPDCIPVRLMTGISVKRTERLRDSGEASMRDKMRCFDTDREWFRFSEQA